MIGLLLGPAAWWTAVALALAAAGGMPEGMRAVAAPLMAIWAGWALLAAFATRWSVALGIEAGEIVLRTGILSRVTRRAWADEVVGIDVSQGLVGRLLGYGDVEVETRGNDAIAAFAVSDPRGFEDAVRVHRAERPAREPWTDRRAL